MTERRLAIIFPLCLLLLLAITCHRTRPHTTPRRAFGTSADVYIVAVHGNWFINKSYATDGNELLYRPESPNFAHANPTTPEQTRVSGITRCAWTTKQFVGVTSGHDYHVYRDHGTTMHHFFGKRYVMLEFDTHALTISRQLPRRWPISAHQLRRLIAYPWQRDFTYGDED